MKFTVKQAKNSFFDRAAVLKKLEAGRRQALSKAGAFVRKSARDLLRYREDPSPPGKPPSVHRTMTRPGKPTRSGKPRKTQGVSPLREFVFFAYDEASKTCVVGPARLNKPGNAPSALEYGGTAVVRRDGRDVTVRIAARPYMAPALAQGLADLPPRFRDLVTR